MTWQHPFLGTRLALQRLYQALSQQPGSTVALGERVNGHPDVPRKDRMHAVTM
jgi:hypothetical protein